MSAPSRLELCRIVFGAGEGCRMASLPDAELLAAVTRRTAPRLETLRRTEVEAPLALSRLWTVHDLPAGQYDQRDQAVMALTSRLLVALGGNRSGKTHAQLDLDVVMACGREHPHTAAYCRLNGIPLELIPSGPGDVYVVADSSSTSRRNHRPAIDARLPPGAEWYGRNALTEAYVTIKSPGSKKYGTIWFKSIDQGAKSFKGSEGRLYHIDEEPEDFGVIEECLRGAASVGGHVVITATPQAGITPMVSRLVIGKEYGAVTTRLNSLHNRLVPNYAGVLAWLESMDPQERAMRETGAWVDRNGPVYPDFSAVTHSVQSFRIPDSWPRYRGMDFGFNFACVWLAISPDGRRYVYRVLSGQGRSDQQWADAIHEAEGATRGTDGVYRHHTERIELTVGDGAAPASIAVMAANNIPVYRARKAVQTGLGAVRDSLQRMPDGRPRTLVLVGPEMGTAALFAEAHAYRYDPRRKDGAPLKTADHIMDAWRYVTMAIASYA